MLLKKLEDDFYYINIFFFVIQSSISKNTFSLYFSIVYI